jgi:hypothetical protein
MVEKWFRRCPALPEQFNFPTFSEVLARLKDPRAWDYQPGGSATHPRIKASPGLGAGLRIVKAFRPIA